MTDSRQAASLAVLRQITAAASLSATDAEPIRLAKNDLWRTPATTSSEYPAPARRPPRPAKSP